MDILKWFTQNFPDYVKKMKECSYHFDEINIDEQHLEENVWSHTVLAYQQAIKYELSDTLKWAIVLHSLGKTLTREVDSRNKRITFRGYESISIYLSLEVLAYTKLGQVQKEEIIKLISYQSVILNYLLTNNPNFPQLVEKFKYQEGFLFDFVQMGRCLVLGRVVSETKKELYREKEINKKTNLIKRIKNRVNKHKLKDKNLYILVGPPGSGKSSLVKEKIKRDMFVVSLDDCIEQMGKKYYKYSFNESYSLYLENEIFKIEADYLERELEEKAKQSNKDIIIDNPNLNKKFRSKYIDFYSDTHNIKVIVLLRPLNDLIKRDRKREISIKKSLGRKELLNKIKEFEVPLLSENVDEIDFVFYE